MLRAIAHFLFVFVMMMFSFAIGLNKLYNHYEGQERTENGEVVRQNDAFLRLVVVC